MTTHTPDRYPNETIDSLRDVLLHAGFVRCDIPACNCGSWHHRYGLRQRFDEIKDALTDAGHPPCNANGNLPIRALAELVQERDAMRLALELICAGVASVLGKDFVLWNPDHSGFPVAIQPTWTATIEAIGWDMAREALAASKGDRNG